MVTFRYDWVSIKQSLQDFWVYAIQWDFKSSMRYFGVRSGPFMRIKYTLLFQILIFCMDLKGKFAYDGFFVEVSQLLSKFDPDRSREWYNFYVGRCGRVIHSEIKCL